MKILFITRKYPPQVGGMESYSRDFVRAMGENVIVLALHKKQWHLWWWLPYALIRGLWLARKVESVHLGDGVLAGLGVIIKFVTRKPVTVTVHGLDLTFNKFGYRRYCQWSLPRLSGIVAVSPATAQLVQQLYHLPATVISNGITVADWPLNTELGKNRCLLFVGRLVERKGCGWFIEQVLPKLPDVHLHIVGDGPDRQRYEQLVQTLQLSDRVRWHGQVSNSELSVHYCAAQALIMPNIIVPNNVEGFGVVALEAAACGLPVIAANLQGMQSAVIDGKTGFLVKSADTAGWIKVVEYILTTPLSAESVRLTVDQQFSWQHIIEQYKDFFKIIYGSTHN